MVNCVARKRASFPDMGKHVDLPSELKGNVLLRESKLNDAARGAVETRAEGPCDFERVSEELRKLERPAPPGKGN